MNWDLIVEKREKSCLSLTMRNWVYGFEWRRTTKNRPDKEAKWRRRAPTAKAHPDASCFINRIQHSIHQNVTSPVHPWKINNTACLGKNICFANKITQQAHYSSCLLRSSHCPSPPSFPVRLRGGVDATGGQEPDLPFAFTIEISVQQRLGRDRRLDKVTKWGKSWRKSWWKMDGKGILQPESKGSLRKTMDSGS